MGSLQSAMDAHGDVVGMLRASQAGIYVYPVVAAEFSNWRSEQMAWRQTAVLFDQSHHMDELTVEGPDAAAFLEGLAINSFKGFGTDRAKHYVPVTPDGYVIGDMICFREAEDRFVLVGRAPVANWVMWNASLGRHRVATRHDPRSPSAPDGRAVDRQHYRFQIQGPAAPAILEAVNGGPVPDIRFFHVGEITVAGRRVRALRHGMAGAPGLEIWGPYAERDAVRDAILEAGAPHGLKRVGARAYSTNTLESGWIPSPLPAIYTGEALRPYREWLSERSYEALGSLGGSFVSDRIEDYYVTPWELGYDFYIRHDHAFVGDAALKAMAGGPHRRKVTFEWNADDLMAVIRSSFEPGGENAKWVDLPQPNYASTSADRVMLGERMVGMSMFNGYSFNERAMLSLGVVDPDIREGDVLTLVWGEPGGGSAKSAVEPHVQAAIRVRVSPVPYARAVREGYEGSWRARQD